jgi:peptidoglycan-associated lipoprotein
MTQQCTAKTTRAVLLAFLCIALGACSTTQKKSSGEEAAFPWATGAPVSEASKTTSEIPKTAEPASPASVGVKSDAMPTRGNPQSEVAAKTETAAPAGRPDEDVARVAREEAGRAKRQLAEEDARINKLREEIQLAKRNMEQETARQSASSAKPANPVPSQNVQAGAETPKSVNNVTVLPADTRSAERIAARDARTVRKPLERSVYFDFDKWDIKAEYDPMLMGHAVYLKGHHDTPTEIQGNCDERGSREYNLALGARRAEAVKRALELLGADGSNIKTVSFGSEKPIAAGKDEASYSQNRRADVLD